jgi:tRNA(Arg) A34 adenosine deaminase TadA
MLVVFDLFILANVLLYMNPRFMKLALEEGWRGYSSGDEPFGACIAKDDVVVCVAHNTINSRLDLTGHAELNAIRFACSLLETVDLSGCEIYATFKPCNMCLEACKRAGIVDIYFGAGPKDVVYPVGDRDVNLVGGFLLEECLELTSKKYRPLNNT